MTGKSHPANLQPSLTVKQAAELMNVSERTVYMALRVLRLRPDLAAKMKAGSMSVNEAYRRTTNRAMPTSYDRLVTAWNAAGEHDRIRFIALLDGDFGDKGGSHGK